MVLGLINFGDNFSLGRKYLKTVDFQGGTGVTRC